MAHTEPDTSMPCLNFESPALWPIKTHHDKMEQTHKSVLMGLHIISCIVSARTSRDVVLNVSSRYCLGLVALTSRSRSRLSFETLTSRVSASYVSLTTLFCRPTRNCSMANRLHIAKQGYGCACQNGGGFHSRARL